MHQYTIPYIFKQQGIINLTYKIITYLSLQTIQQIISCYQSCFKDQNKDHLKQAQKNQFINKCSQKKQRRNNLEQSYFFILIKNYYYIKEYLNKVDRSFYFSIYQQKQFQYLEQELISNIVISQTKALFNLKNEFKQKKYLKIEEQSNNNEITNIQLLIQQQKLDRQYQQIYQQGILNSNNNNSWKLQKINLKNNLNKSIGIENIQNNNLSVFIDKFNQILNKFQKQIQTNNGQKQQIKRIFLDPSFPLPKMKRQNQGIYCNSSFQLFLVSLRFNHQFMDNFSLFDNLKQFLTLKQQSLLKSFIQIQRDKYKYPKNYQNLHFLRYTAYEVLHQNYQSLLVINNTLHNMLVFLFALTDIYISSIFKYIQAIKDPLYKIIELMCRYSVFRSFILEIQENLGFMFEMYDTLYSDSIRDSVSNKPKFSFWRPAMTKWSSKMNNIHQITNVGYFTLLTKMRKDNLYQIINKYPLLKQSKIIIQNNLSMNNQLDQFNYNNSDQHLKLTFSMSESELTNFFQQNYQLYDLLTMQYTQYMVDLSIDQFTVHWCGHSQHSLQKNYINFQEQFIKYNRVYNQYLNSSMYINNNQKFQSKLLNIFIQEQLNFLQNKNIKPLTLKCILNDINEIFCDYNINQINQLVQDIYKLVPLKIDFTFKDENLKYFNQKAKIVQSLDQSDKLYFSIHPSLSPQQILIRSIEVNDCQNFSKLNKKKLCNSDEHEQKGKQAQFLDNQDNNVHDNSYEYISDSQQSQIINAYAKSNIKNIKKTKSQIINQGNEEKQFNNKSDKINENLDMIQNSLVVGQLLNSFLKSSNSTNESMNQSNQINKIMLIEQQNHILAASQQIIITQQEK